MSNVLVPSPPPQWPMPGTMNRRAASRTFFTFVLRQHVLVVVDDVSGRNAGIAPPGVDQQLAVLQQLREIGIDRGQLTDHLVGLRDVAVVVQRQRIPVGIPHHEVPIDVDGVSDRLRAGRRGPAQLAAGKQRREYQLTLRGSSRRCRSCARPPPAVR